MVNKIIYSDFERIVIYGPSGSGKSTLAKTIGSILKSDIIHIDDVFWLPNWIEMDKSELVEKLKPKINRERWILDGNYTKVRKISLKRATFAIILVPYPFITYWRIFWRQFARHTNLKLVKFTPSPLNVQNNSPPEHIFKGIFILTQSAFRFFSNKIRIIHRELIDSGLMEKTIFVRNKNDRQQLLTFLRSKSV